MSPHFLLPTEKYHNCTLVPAWIQTCLLSGLSAVTRSPEGSSPGALSFNITFFCRSVSSICCTGKKSLHIFNLQWSRVRLPTQKPPNCCLIILVSFYTKQPWCQRLLFIISCWNRYVHMSLFQGAGSQVRSLPCLGPAFALALNLEVIMLHPARWHKLHAVIIPQRHVKPGLGSLLW